MKIHRRAAHIDLEVRETPERRENRRLPRAEHRRVGDDYCVAGKQILVGYYELLEVVTADFLLTLCHQNHVYGKLAACLELRFERLDVQKELAFVVDRPARVDISVAHRRLEWR